MGEVSKIEWTDSTFNPWTGCQKVSPGCDHCYAEGWSKRTGMVKWGPGEDRRRTTAANWKKPREWNADAERFQREHGRRQRVFCASLSDWLDNQVPKFWRDDLRKLIDETPALDWLLLTKRPQNARKLVPDDWWGRPNVWLGTTTEEQKYFDERWPYLAAIPAVVRFLSYEPATGPMIPHTAHNGAIPDWIICGGESGPQARAMKGQWARELQSDCKTRGIAFFHKQWGAYQSNPLLSENAMPISEVRRLDPDGKGGKKLDGIVYHEFPSARELTQ